jgi:hypothetical protein
MIVRRSSSLAKITKSLVQVGNMRIGLDLDGVVVDLFPEVELRCRESGIEFPSGDYPSEWFSDPLMFLNAHPYEDAWALVNKWFGMGHDIFIITARKREVRDVTYRWLSEWDIIYNDIFFKPTAKKWEFGKELGLDFFVDDHIRAVRPMRDNGVKCYHLVRDSLYDLRDTEDNDPDLTKSLWEIAGKEGI